MWNEWEIRFHEFLSPWRGHGCPSHSRQDNICLLSSSTSCMKDVYPHTPPVTYCTGNFICCPSLPRSLCFLFFPMQKLGEGTASRMQQAHLLGGSRVLCRIWGRVEDTGMREGIFISITGHFHFGNREQPWLLLTQEYPRDALNWWEFQLHTRFLFREAEMGCPSQRYMCLGAPGFW